MVSVLEAIDMQDRDTDCRGVLDDFDPYIDDAERAELGESRVLVKDELYMPVHPTRDWIKCYVTSTQQDGFRYAMFTYHVRFLYFFYIVPCNFLYQNVFGRQWKAVPLECKKL